MNLRVGAGAFAEGRYDRQRRMEWWDQERVANARLLVVGAGALGNEILKNLALMGAGRLLVYDFDVIERSNLSRAVLFREEDEGRSKAETAVRRLRELNPEVHAVARTGNLVHEAGLGIFHWADLVLCGVDNREARLFVNSACARTRRVWVDGAIEGLSGIIRAFDPAQGACYECTMNETDRKLVAERRSCAQLARDAVAQGHVPATAVAASIVGALEVQEAFKILHGQPALVGEGLHLHGRWGDVSRVRYPRREECPGHETLPPATPLGAGADDVTLGDLLGRAERELGEGACLDFSRDVVTKLTCPECGAEEPGAAVLGQLGEREAACPRCGVHRIVSTAAGATREGEVDLSRTPAGIGLPRFDIMVARQGLEARSAWLLDGDAAAVLGPLADSLQRSGEP